MRRTRTVLALLAGLVAMIAIIATGTAQASTSFQAGDENCVACHTSKETLQELAVEPEEEEELSEGEG